MADGYSVPLELGQVTITDPFWRQRRELVRTVVLPYQWNALNDRVDGAEPSYCMHNFRAAARQNEKRATLGQTFVPPTRTDKGFNTLPDDPANPDPDTFYGYVFQDTDFSKWIEAVGYSLAAHPDPELEKTADDAIDIVCKAQLDNGYLDTYYILNGMGSHFTNLKDHHELYCLGHLVEGAVAYYQGTGKSKLLDAACRFADYVAQVFGSGEGKLHGYPGHEIAEMALVRLFEVTGEQRYLDLASYFIHERGRNPLYFEIEDRERAAREGISFEQNTNLPMPYAYYQAHQPVEDQQEAVGHAVRAVYLYSGMADIARLTSNRALSDAARRLWRNIVDKKLYITGGIGATASGEAFSGNYDLPNDLAYCETCASIGLIFFARRMLQNEPKAEYADVMERALYNTVLAGMAMDGKSFFYVNPLEVRPETAHGRDERFAHVQPVRQKWFGCACCPPNIARLIESLQEYVYTFNATANTLYVHLYIGSDAHVSFNGVDMTVRLSADMPWNSKGRIDIGIPSGSCEATFALRLPGWTGEGDAASFVSSPEGMERHTKDGYLYLKGIWKEGDAITFDFPMPVEMVAANPRVSEDAGRVAFVRGPLTFCAEERDNGNLLQSLVVNSSAVTGVGQGIHVIPFDFHSGARGADERGTGEVEPMTTSMLKLEVPSWREDVPNEVEDGASIEQARTPLYTRWTQAKRQSTYATLIPYYAWANRGENEMRVFLRVQ